MDKLISSNYIKLTKKAFFKNGSLSFQQIRAIFSKSGKWDEAIPTPAVLREVEQHWKDVFDQQQSLDTRPETATIQQGRPGKSCKYVLAMFPYPSGQLHMGHVRVYTISDTLARYYRAQGHQVIHPIGWDAFGLPAENAAIERGVSPAAWTEHNIRSMKEQFRQIGCRFDWWREQSTCDPRYYRWTQDLFLRLFRAGLVYKKEAYVNWDPVDQTVLANEQVDQQGRAWRSGALVQRRLLNQWYIQTSRFSESLEAGLSDPQLEDWEHIALMQRHWIGPCDGFLVHLPLQPHPATGKDCSSTPSSSSSSASSVSVFTQHPELLAGVSFLAVRSDNTLLINEAVGSPGGLAAKKQDAGLSDQISSIYREDSPSLHPILKAVVLNPITGKTIPIIVADDLPYLETPSGHVEFYLGYGSGSDIDRKICATCNFEATSVLEDFTLLDYMKATTPKSAGMEPKQVEKKPAGTRIKLYKDNVEIPLPPKKGKTSKSDVSNADEAGDTHPDLDVLNSVRLINCGDLSGLTAGEARQAVRNRLREAGAGGYPASARIRDWLISRQRYWGTPIPLIHCPGCGTVPVPATDLPVLLPVHQQQQEEEEAGQDAGIIQSLHSHHQWKRCTCPTCGGPAERETDTMDTFVDSSWYFLRFVDPLNSTQPFSSELVDRFMPVDVYVGGEEHAVLHLYSARFLQHFLHSEQLTRHSEPFNRLVMVGRVNAPTYICDGRYLREGEVDLTVDSPVDRTTGQPVQVVVEKMSKSKHNGVAPASVVSEASTDLMRLAMLYGEHSKFNRNWTRDSIDVAQKLVAYVWRAVGTYVQQRQLGSSAQGAVDEAVARQCASLRGIRNRSIHNVTEDYEAGLLHAALLKLQSFAMQLKDVPLPVVHEDEFERSLEALLVMLAPVAPHVTAELWQAVASHARLRQHRPQGESVHEQPFPQPDEGFQMETKFGISVNGDMVYKGRLGINELTNLDELHLLEELQKRETRLRESIAGQPVLRTCLDTSKPAVAWLYVSTLTFEQMKQKNLEKKQAKKLSFNKSSKKASDQKK